MAGVSKKKALEKIKGHEKALAKIKLQVEQIMGHFPSARFSLFSSAMVLIFPLHI